MTKKDKVLYCLEKVIVAFPCDEGSFQSSGVGVLSYQVLLRNLKPYNNTSDISRTCGLSRFNVSYLK